MTPVLNEAWILERFLQCTSLWADHIIIADQKSTDGSREIARRFPKVKIVDNASGTYDENQRQQMLVAEARRIPGPRLLLALDADEFFTANFLTHPEWDTILRAPPGTVISFPWPFVHSRGTELGYFLLAKEQIAGFMDDESGHQGAVIHSCRVPTPPGARRLQLRAIKLMHYCLMDYSRAESRLRWYRSWEQVNRGKHPIEIYRFYNTLFAVPHNAVKPVPAEWIEGYERQGIDMTSTNRDGSYRWDRDVVQMFEEHGTARFKRLSIWDADWSNLHAEMHPDKPRKRFDDPRNGFEKLVHRWLRWTQRYYCSQESPTFFGKVHHRLVETALRPFRW